MQGIIHCCKESFIVDAVESSQVTFDKNDILANFDLVLGKHILSTVAASSMLVVCNLLDKDISKLNTADLFHARTHQISGSITSIQRSSDSLLKAVCHLHLKSRYCSFWQSIKRCAHTKSSEADGQHTFGRLRPYLHIMAALNTMAMGLALSCPAMSGAEPCTCTYKCNR